MTQQDRDRLVVLRKAEKKLIGQGQAARELGVTSRQIRRLLRRLKKDGDKAVMHKLRGRPSNRRTGGKTREKIVRILSEDVHRDFGPTLASEYLAAKHDIRIGREALRQIMISGGLWRARGQKVDAVHQWRERRSCRGELILTIGKDRWSILSWIRWSMPLRLWPTPVRTTGWKGAAGRSI